MADPSLCIGENHGAVLELLINLTLFSIVLEFTLQVTMIKINQNPLFHKKHNQKYTWENTKLEQKVQYLETHLFSTVWKRYTYIAANASSVQ